MGNQTVLFVGHDASRTGAPIVFLHLLRWLRRNTLLEFDVLLRRGGPLERDFREVSRELLFWPERDSRFQRVCKLRIPRLGARIAEALPKPRERLVSQVAGRGYSCVYVNTCFASDVLLQLLPALQVPAVMHIHELEQTLRSAPGGVSLVRAALARVDRVVAVSALVQDNLVRRHSVELPSIVRIPEFIEEDHSLGADGGAVRRELRIPADEFVVGGCGMMGWRKGTDLFVLVAASIARRYPDRKVHFVWLGGSPDDRTLQQLLEDVEKLGLEHSMHFPGSRTQPADFYSMFDVLLMTSREDPFPLVCLEAGQAGCPLVCFENAVGSAEYIDAECGAVVPYLNVEAMADAVMEFANDSERLTAAGLEIRSRVLPYGVERCAPLVLDVLNDLLSTPVVQVAARSEQETVR